MIQRNTADLWNRVWTKPASVDKDLFRVAKEERLIRWQRIEAIVIARYGAFSNLSVIELGAGRGTNAALMAQRGAKVAVVDYSETALERSRRLFDSLGLRVELILQDALDLPARLCGRYDVSMSFGLAEHFLDEKRRAILKAHFDLLKDGGITFISVPNRSNPPYRLYKWITERTGRWSVGEEYPFSRAELERWCASFGVSEFGFFGDSLWRSKKFLNPLKWFPRRRKPRPPERTDAAAAPPAATPSPRPSGRRRRRRLPRPERGTWLDAYYSYALVLWASKPSVLDPS
ncbi:MAG TPA: class I SAM-dependent methyltransferase [Gammaproteobacteria bacterium]